MKAFTRAHCPYCATITVHEWTCELDDQGDLVGGPHHCCQCGWERCGASLTSHRSSWLSHLLSSARSAVDQIIVTAIAVICLFALALVDLGWTQ